MHRFLALALACMLLGACSSRALRPADDDMWAGYAGSNAAAFLGYHGRVERLPGNQAE